MVEGNWGNTIKAQRSPLELFGIKAENIRIEKKYYAYDMPNDKTYIGYKDGNWLEDVIVTPTICHIQGTGSKAVDVVNHYILVYVEAIKQLPAEALHHLDDGNCLESCIERWNLGTDILQ